jgi:pyruvate dehydrogenase E1 component
MNENYHQPAMPEGSEKGIIRGMYLLQKGGRKKTRVQLLGSGTILMEVIAAADLLEKDFNVSADVWSVTSFTELRRDGMAVDRWNMLHVEEEPRRAYVEELLADAKGPAIAATDYMRTYADQIRPWVHRRFVVLGTDGYGRSDMRSQLRKFFEVNRYYVAVAALKALADEGALDKADVAKAIKKYKIDPDKPDPWTV